jgi:hypothetical protein
MSVAPFTRGLPYVLREQLERLGNQPTLLTGEVVDSVGTDHVTITLGGTNLTIPRLASYSAPKAGDSVYVLGTPLMMIALGTIKS